MKNFDIVCGEPEPSPLAKAALSYAVRGWKIFPVAPIGQGIRKLDGKEPYSGGPTFQQATTDQELIKKWWSERPDANIGLALAPSGLVALDADIYKDPNGWALFCERHELPMTYVQRTAGGGEHHVFLADQGVGYPGKLSDLDGEIKHNGYILLAPSQALSKGNDGNAGVYKVLRNDEPVAAPKWLSGRRNDAPRQSPAGYDPIRTMQNAGVDAEELLQLLGTRQNHFGDRDDWLKVILGVHHMFAGTARESEALDAVVEWSQRWAGTARGLEHTDERVAHDARYAWSHATTDKPNPVTASTAKMLLKKMPEVIASREGLTIVPHKSRPLKEHPVTEWLCDRHYLRGALSLTVAPGGTGKSLLALHEAISMAIGKPLIGSEVFGRRRILYVNGGEDNEVMVKKRVDAALAHHGLTDADLGGRLFIRGAPELASMLGIEHFKFATQSRNEGTIINSSLVEAMVDLLKDHSIDVLILDPLKHFHLVGENDNDGMNELATAFTNIAEHSNCAVEVVHHATKDARVGGKSANLGIAQSRGASALIDKARTARFLSPMSKEEAEKRGQAESRSCVRIAADKSNYAANATSERWFQIKSLKLGNGTVEYPEGDSVGVIELAQLNESLGHQSAEFARDVLVVLPKVRDKCGASEQSTDWLGFAVSDQLNIDAGKGVNKSHRSPEQTRSRTKLTKAISTLERAGVLTAQRERTANGKGRQIWSIDRNKLEGLLHQPAAPLLLP